MNTWTKEICKCKWRQRHDFNTNGWVFSFAWKGGKAADALTHRISGVAEYLRQASYRFIEFNRSSVSTLCGGLGRMVTPKAIASLSIQWVNCRYLGPPTLWELYQIKRQCWFSLCFSLTNIYQVLPNTRSHVLETPRLYIILLAIEVL